MTSKESASRELCPKPPAVFVREATGLVKAFSLTDALAINLGNVIVMTILLWALTVGMYAFPGYDFNLTFLIVTVFSVFWGLTYTLFSVIMPRAGGTYTFVSRVHPALGFATNFAWVIINLVFFWGVGGSVYIGMTFGLSSYLDMIGRITANPSLTALGPQMTSGFPSFILATIFLVICVGVCMLPQRLTSLTLKILFAVSMLNFIAPYIGFFTTSHAQYVTLFNDFTSKYYPGVSYQGIIDLATANGWSHSAYSIPNSIVALPVAFLGIYGFNQVVFVGGEVKGGYRNLLFSTILALLVCFIVSTIGWTMMTNAVGYDFMGAAAFLTNTGKYPLPTYSVTPFGFSVPIYPDAFTTSVTFITFTIQQVLFFVVTRTIIGARTMFAWSFDRLAPEWLSKVHERFHSPINALSVIFVGGFITIAFYVYVPWLTVLYNTLPFIFIMEVVIGLAAVAFPYVRKDLFNAAPPIARTKIAGIPLLSISGAITAVAMAISTVASMLNPLVSGPVGLVAFSLGILTFIIGFAWYYVAKWYRAKQGIDVSMIFRQIPPE